MAPGTLIDLDVDALLGLRHLAARMRLASPAPRAGLPGGIVHKRRGRGLEVHDIRLWQEGDDIRHLDRHATARTGVPHVRTFRDERERTTLLVADFRPAMLFGTRRTLRSVAAAEALTLLGWRAIAEGGRVGLAATTPEAMFFARRGRGARAMIGLIGELVLAHRSALGSRVIVDPPLVDALAEAEILAGAGATIIVATALDHPGAKLDAMVGRIAQRHDLLFVLVQDAFEVAAPAGAYPYVGDDGRTNWLRASGQMVPDQRLAQLRRLGARAIMLPYHLGAEAMAHNLGRDDA